VREVGPSLWGGVSDGGANLYESLRDLIEEFVWCCQMKGRTLGVISCVMKTSVFMVSRRIDDEMFERRLENLK